MQRMDMTLADIHKLAKAADSKPVSAIPVSARIEGISFFVNQKQMYQCCTVLARIARHMPFLRYSCSIEIVHHHANCFQSYICGKQVV